MDNSLKNAMLAGRAEARDTAGTMPESTSAKRTGSSGGEGRSSGPPHPKNRLLAGPALLRMSAGSRAGACGWPGGAACALAVGGWPWRVGLPRGVKPFLAVAEHTAGRALAVGGGFCVGLYLRVLRR